MRPRSNVEEYEAIQRSRRHRNQSIEPVLQQQTKGGIEQSIPWPILNAFLTSAEGPIVPCPAGCTIVQWDDGHWACECEGNTQPFPRSISTVLSNRLRRFAASARVSPAEFLAAVNRMRVTGDSIVHVESGTQPTVHRNPEGGCYDAAAGVVRYADGSEMSVSLASIAPRRDGSLVAMVANEQGQYHVPMCDDPVVECCYDAAAQKLVCPGTALHDVDAGIVAAWQADGQIYVWATWNGGGARMPLCDPQVECPPVFCCVNVQTFQYVCPGRPEINGTAAPVTDIVQEGGYSWGVLEDGTRLPLCGSELPAPRVVVAAAAPRGLWMSADPDASPAVINPSPMPNPAPATKKANPESQPRDHDHHGCPTCPPGMLLDTQNGRCVPVPAHYRPALEFCPPWWELKGSCCASCAQGNTCDGETCSSNPGPTPQGVQSLIAVDPTARKRRRRSIFGGR